MAAREADRRFEYAVEDILRATWEFYPHMASGLGLHEYDGRLSDISGALPGPQVRTAEGCPGLPPSPNPPMDRDGRREGSGRG